MLINVGTCLHVLTLRKIRDKMFKNFDSVNFGNFGTFQK